MTTEHSILFQSAESLQNINDNSIDLVVTSPPYPMIEMWDLDEVQGYIDRTDDFRDDPKIRTGSAELDDYRHSGFDRGHLAPAADFSWSKEAMSDTFYLSNMSPQKPGFNRGIWRSLES